VNVFEAPVGVIPDIDGSTSFFNLAVYDRYMTKEQKEEETLKQY